MWDELESIIKEHYRLWVWSYVFDGVGGEKKIHYGASIEDAHFSCEKHSGIARTIEEAVTMAIKSYKQSKGII